MHAETTETHPCPSSGILDTNNDASAASRWPSVDPRAAPKQTREEPDMGRSPDTVAVRFELTAARVEGEVSSIARQPVSSGPEVAIGHLRRRQHPADGELAYGPRREYLSGCVSDDESRRG